MYSSSKKNAVITEKIDVRNIAINLANRINKLVHIPNNVELRVKEYIRMTNNFEKDLKKIKQQILVYVLILAYRYNGKSKWTIAHIK